MGKESDQLPSDQSQALLPGPRDKLWPPGSRLKVYFTNELPASPKIKYGKNFIITTQIIDWMNEWHTEGSSVPTFEETGTSVGSDVRVKFIDEGKLSGLVYW